MSEAKVTRKHREMALGVLGYHPSPSAPDWTADGVGSFCSSYDEANAIAQAIVDAEARGKKSAIDVLRRRLKFYRDKQTELGALGSAGDLDARGRSYEYGLSVDFVQELIEECEDGEG